MLGELGTLLSSSISKSVEVAFGEVCSKPDFDEAKTVIDAAGDDGFTESLGKKLLELSQSKTSKKAYKMFQKYKEHGSLFA